MIQAEGIFVGNGGGAKISYGTITITQDYASGTLEITHGLGTVPDFVFMSLCNVRYSKNASEIDTVFGRRSGTSELFGGLSAQKYMRSPNSPSGTSGSLYTMYAAKLDEDYGIDSDSGIRIINASDTNFYLTFSSANKFYSGNTYFWMAIGGLES